MTTDTPDTPRAGAEKIALPWPRWCLEKYSNGVEVWLDNYSGGASQEGSWGTLTLRFIGADGEETTAKYAALTPDLPAADAGAAAVPEGYKLVPVHPTTAMKEAGGRVVRGHDFSHECYAQMLDAAPEPPALARSPAPAGRPSREAVARAMVVQRASLPVWDELPYRYRQSWLETADAVLALFDTPPDAEAKP